MASDVEQLPEGNYLYHAIRGGGWEPCVLWRRDPEGLNELVATFPGFDGAVPVVALQGALMGPLKPPKLAAKLDRGLLLITNPRGIPVG